MGRQPSHPNQRRRRNASSPFYELPAEGRSGKAPKWPLSKLTNQGSGDYPEGPITKLELELWRELWALPQAVAWEALGYLREVAHYVRWAIKGELGDLDAAKEARQLSDRIGLTPRACRYLGWVIVDSESMSGTGPGGRGGKPADVLNVTDIQDKIRARRASGQ